MAIIKCKMCGGDIELTADKTFGTCEFCGSTMTLPKVDDDQRAAAFNRGNHFRRIGEFDKALAVYERIVRENDTDAEAHWCCALCRFGIEYVEDPASYEYVPTCHRVSFDSFLEDVDYLAAVEYSEGITKRQYQKDAAKIAEVQRGILATSQNAEPFDVFICYKESDEVGNRTRDSLLAQDIYYQLTEQGRRVFFSRITLEDMVGKQYEPYIFAALNSARVMIVVGTKAEYMNAVWVKNEWSRFLAIMKKDRHKLLLPCYRDMDPYDMPEQLSVLQSYDMSKIGFVQDLTRGIAKVLDAEKKLDPVKETVMVQQMANNNVAALLKRGYLALEDGDWEKADGFFEEVLNQDAENVDSYLGKAMTEMRVNVREDLNTCTAQIENNHYYKKALRFSNPEQRAFLQEYVQKNTEHILQCCEVAMNAGEWKNAEKLYDIALSRNPRDSKVWWGLLIAKICTNSLAHLIEGICHNIRHNVVLENADLTIELTGYAEQFVVPGVLTLEHIKKIVPQSVGYVTGYNYWREQKEFFEQYEIEELWKATSALIRKHLGDVLSTHAQFDLLDDMVVCLSVEEKQQITEILMAFREEIEEKYTWEIGSVEREKAKCFSNSDELKLRYERATEFRENQYQETCARQAKAWEMWDLRTVRNDFLRLGDYKDCAQRAKECYQKLNQLERENRQRLQWRNSGLCSHCGGNFKGIFAPKCTSCGKVKDY